MNLNFEDGRGSKPKYIRNLKHLYDFLIKLQQFAKNKQKCLCFQPFSNMVEFMEDGGVDRTVIDCQQNQLGQMADFPPLLTF